MSKIPETVLLTILPEAVPSVENWWATLSLSAQQELVHLWDGRSDSCAFEYTLESDGSYSWTPIPIDIGVQYQHPDGASTHNTWHRDLYEYIVSHPEVMVSAQFSQRTFHICRSHLEARSVLEAGVIPAEFDCPFADQQCPMRTLLGVAPGHSVVLFAKPSSRATQVTDQMSDDGGA